MIIQKEKLSAITGRGNVLIYLVLTLASMLTLPAVSPGNDIYPARKITWIIPMKPGGGQDVSARIFSPYLEKHLKRMLPKAKGGNIVIKNEPGSSGDRATSFICNAPPDGYNIATILGSYLGSSYITKPDFDVTKLTFLFQSDETIRLLATRKAGPRDWDEVVAASKIRPIKWGVGAYAQETHIKSIIANEVLGLSAKLIPFGGTAENVSALVRGDVLISSVSEESVFTLINAGELRPLLSFGRKSVYPGVLSIQDLGHPELINPMKGIRFLAGPPNLPKEISQIIVEAAKRAYQDEGFLAASKKMGLDLNPIFGKDLDKLIEEEINFFRKNADLIKKRLD